MSKTAQTIFTAATLVLFGFCLAVFLSPDRAGRPPSTRIDTTYHRYIDCVRSYRPEPLRIIYQQLPNGARTDTVAALTDYNAKKIYSDTQVVKYGKIVIKDTISANRIQGREILTDFTIPTITKTFYQQPKRKIFIGADIYASPGSLLQGAGPVITLQNKRDQLIEAGAFFNKSGQPIYRLGIRAKIHL